MSSTTNEAGAPPVHVNKHDKCVHAAESTLLTVAPITGAVVGGAWYGFGKFFPKVAAVNWRIKAVSSCVTLLAFSYWRAEHAMISCVQEYQERDRLKALRLRNKQRAEAATAAAAAANPTNSA